jgi:ABC-type Na+ efflux pump permease subunit
MYGPIFQREQSVLPKRPRHFLARFIFAATLFSLVCTTWLLLAGIQPVRNLGDIARLGSIVFLILAPLQLLVLSAAAALAGASGVAHEKDRRTLILLLMSSLSSPEIVLGKIGAGLLPVLNMFLTGAPVLMLLTWLGGVSVSQVIACLLLTFTCIFLCAALGAVVAFWREKTFQAIAVAILTIVLWLAFWEIVAAGGVPGFSKNWALAGSPVRTIFAICQPVRAAGDGTLWSGLMAPSMLLLWSMIVALSTTGIAMLRIWNPSRQARPKSDSETPPEAIVSDSETMPTTLATPIGSPTSPLAATIQADSVTRNAGRDGPTKAKAWRARSARRVWSNPILWREMRTWAYGKKVLFIRLAYIALFLLAAGALYQSIESGSALGRSTLSKELIPAAAKSLTPFFIVSLVILNALAVNSITNERDGQALDLLLVTEITPVQFMLGKIFGVLYVAKEMVLLPIALCVYLWYSGGINLENLSYTVMALLVMDFFVVMLGIHCGMIYSQSRNGIIISLATVFFLFVGVITCMLIMISFRGSFGRQLAPFLTIILGGGVGLFIALGSRNPSPAITIAAFGLPFLTFFSITSFIVRDQELTVFSVISVAYAFATAAMLIPALSEFDFAMGGNRNPDDEPQ